MDKVIFISTPLRGDTDVNLELARRVCLMELRLGNVPLCPHCLTVPVLGLRDGVFSERLTGKSYSLSVLQLAHEVLAIRTQDGHLSEGCQEEVNLARSIDIPVLIRPWPWWLLVRIGFDWDMTGDAMDSYNTWRSLDD